MSELSKVVKSGLAKEFCQRATEMYQWVDPLSEEEFWTNPYEYGNSVGHLVLHLTGNLNYYIGAQIAAMQYIRNRDLEFTEMGRPSKAEVLGRFDAAIAMVAATLEQQSEEDWTMPYTAEREPEAKDRFTAFLKCVVHFYHHVGQINYLSRELRKR